MSIPPEGGAPPVGDLPGDPQLLTDARGAADVHAFLIADVRGWTAFTQAHGDEDAARLAGRFAEVTRAVVEDHRGRVLELRGDEALVVFGSPRSAIRGAVALQQRYVEETIADPSLPLTVGIGLDAGEAVPVEGGFRGGALNVAARLCSLARAGEVLASREIVHLALRVDGVRFTERGPAEMKGLEKPVHVVAVRAEDRDDAQAIAPFVRSTAPPPAPWWRRKTVVGVVAFAVLAAAVAVPLLARRGGASSEIEPNSIGVLDPVSGEVVETIGPFESRPGSVAASEDAVWVTNPDVGTVTQFDPNEQQIRDTVQVGEDPTGIAVGFDAVWVVNSGGPSVSRISADTGEPFDPIPVGNGPAGIAISEESVWVTNRFDGTISRIDPTLGGDVETISVGLDPRGIAVGFDDVWVALAGSNTVVRIDPQTNEVTQSIPVGSAPGSLAVGTSDVWVANTLDDTVWQINPDTNTVVDVVTVGDDPAGIAVVDGIVWVANQGAGTMSRIEPGQTPDQTSVRTLMIGSVPQGLAGVNGELWVSVRGTATSHRGGTLRLVSSLDRFSSLDSRATYDPPSSPVLHLLGDGLVAFEPIGGTNPRLVPDLATSIPTPTDGGHTYTFTLREGIRYSNGEVVSPTDFRFALEQGFRLNAGAHAYLYDGLIGGKACGNEPETCDLSQGIETDDETGTITFHLVQPDPEFLYKLTMPFAYPAPPSTPDEEQLLAGIPGTGPYMLKTTEGLALVRNPHFRVWSAQAQPHGYVDRIEWTFGVEPDAQIEAVAAGDADVALDTSYSDSLDQLFVQSAAQVHTSPRSATYWIVFGIDTPPFDNVEVRRALNLALDRDRWVQLLGGPTAALPTCQNLPPNFPGYKPYCPYTLNPGPEGEGSWTAPNMEKAQRLVDRSGTAGMEVVMEVVMEAAEPLDLDYIVELLDDLGYRGSVRQLPLDRFLSPDNEFQMALAGWGADYPSASNFISLVRCDATTVPSGGFCDPRIDDMIDRANQAQLEDPAAAGELWAEIDRAVVNQAPYLWQANPIAVEFVSERVDNYQWSHQWGVLLNQLWVR